MREDTEAYWNEVYRRSSSSGLYYDGWLDGYAATVADGEVSALGSALPGGGSSALGSALPGGGSSALGSALPGSGGRAENRAGSSVQTIGSGSRVLDIGCGRGSNLRFLLDCGAVVSACDLSCTALDDVRNNFPGAHINKVDLRDPLPYADQSFDCVIASLSLHYFDWATTESIVKEIDRILIPSGLFVFRVNSDQDLKFGAGIGEEVEPGYYCANGHYKRFFDRSMIDALLTGWSIMTVERQVIEIVHKHVFFAVAYKTTV